MKKLPFTGALLAVTTAALLAASYGILRAASETPANDCLIGIEDQDGTVESEINCTDGDACDADGQVNKSCTVRVKGCLNIPNTTGCAARPIKKAKITPPKAHVTVTPNGSSSVCGSFTDIVVKLKHKGKKAGRKVLKANATTDEHPPARDRDKLTINCLPSTGSTTTTVGSSTTSTTGPSLCPHNPDGGPDQLTLTVGNTGNDLDTGESGKSHNFLNVAGADLKYCLSGCNASTTSQCQAAGSTGDPNNSLNGPTFGPPLPLFSAGVAVCVVNRLNQNPIQGVADVAAGTFDATATPLNLLSDTYQGTDQAVCPRCVNNKCDAASRNPGANCTVDGMVVVNNPPNVNNVNYTVSKSCLPKQANLLGTPNVVLPLTSGTSTLAGNAAGNFPCPGQTKHDECGATTCTVNCGPTGSNIQDAKGGINQTCCSNAAHTPCFPTSAAAGGQLQRTGEPAPISPAWPDPTYPKTGDGTLAATFCIPAVPNAITVNSTAGLPGPGAVLIHGTTRFDKAP